MYYNHWKKGMGFKIIIFGYSFYSIINFEQEIDPEPLSFVFVSAFKSILWCFCLFVNV